MHAGCLACLLMQSTLEQNALVNLSYLGVRLQTVRRSSRVPALALCATRVIVAAAPQAEPEKRRARDPVREQQLERAKQEARAAKHKMCRFTPALKGIVQVRTLWPHGLLSALMGGLVQRHVQDALLQEQYPYLKPPPPPAASDPNSAQRASKSVRRT